jgi:ribosomal protein S7
MHRLKSKSSLFYKLVRFIKYKHRHQAIYFFFEILEVIKPMLSTITRRRGKHFIEIPVILTNREQYIISICWLASNIIKNKEKKLSFKMYYEFISILKKKSSIYLIIQKLNTKVILNRAFQRFK